MFKRMILPLALMMASGAASAGIVTNNTDLLSGEDHAQLSEWLGSDFDLTRIFAKGVDGTTSREWHANVDGKGATFTVMELFDNYTNERRVIGGYNDKNWGSSIAWISSTEAFLFNLSDDLLFEKNNRHSNGGFAIYNDGSYGAAFGAGHDLYVSGDLTTGYANIGRGYGDESQYGQRNYLEEFAGSFSGWTIGAYETYSLSTSTGDFGAGAAIMANDVPVSFLLGGLGILGIAASRRRPGA